MNLNIERSTKINQARILRMKERNSCVDKIKDETKENLLKTKVNPTNHEYKTCLKRLLIQGMIKLLEPELFVKVRKEDLNLVKELKSECEKEFHDIMTKETNEDYKTTLNIVESEFLTAEQGGECGGIVLYSGNRKIVCPNTLKNRLDLCFEELLPEIRKKLFPGKR